MINVGIVIVVILFLFGLFKSIWECCKRDNRNAVVVHPDFYQPSFAVPPSTQYSIDDGSNYGFRDFHPSSELLNV